MEPHPQPPVSPGRQKKHRQSLQILLSSETKEDPLSRFAVNERACFEALASELYDEVWPLWRGRASMQISLQFLDEGRMAELNGQYRHIHAPTDVLTFPLFETDGRFVPDEDSGPLLLGDILLCPPVIRKNAKEHAQPEQSELALVVFHGMLHLLAWDHDTPEREAAMWSVQERYRDRFLERLNRGPSREEEEEA